LRRRLQRLEEQQAPSRLPRYVLARFIDPVRTPEPIPRVVTCRGQRFTRLDHENLDAFVNRVIAGHKAGEGNLLLEELNEDEI
jgi:hypothetical protein